MKTWWMFLGALMALVLRLWAGEPPPPAAAPPKAESTATFRNVDAAGAAQFLKANPKAVILDVRTPGEFAEGRLAKAVNLNLLDPQFPDRLGQLDKTRSYLVHCRSGGRSLKARELMRGLGFQTVYHLDGGLLAWQKAGQPLEKPSPPEGPK